MQILDAPVPQGGNQLVEAFQHLVLHVPGQEIEVLKISSSSRRSRRRRVLLVRTAEQLVEVLEFVSSAVVFQQQIVDAPGSLKDFSLDRIICCVWEQTVDIPIPHGRCGRAGLGGLQGARPGQNSRAFCGAEHVDIPVRQGRGVGTGLLGLRPDPNSAASSAHSPGAADEVFTVVFRTFPWVKKSASLVRTRGRN